MEKSRKDVSILLLKKMSRLKKSHLARRRVSRVIEIVYRKVRLNGKPQYAVSPDCNPELW